MPTALFLLLVAILPPAAAAPSSEADLSRLMAEKNLGLAALEEGDDAQARKRFETVRKLAPEEPLGWADGAVAAMRAKDAADAKKLMAEALRLSPGDARVLALEGTLLELAGDPAAALDAFEKAAAADPKDVASRWNAARLAAAAANGRARAVRHLEAALERAPANLFLLARLCENRREEGNAGAAAALAACDRMAKAIEGRDEKLEKYLGESRAALESGDPAGASLKYRIVENLLRGTPRYQQARRDVEPGVVGLPLEDWSPSLAAKIRSRPAAIAVRFVAKENGQLSALRGLSAVRSSGKDGRDLVFAGEQGLIVASNRDGYRPAAPLPGSAGRAIEVADIANSGGFDLATPGALWTSGKDGYRKTAIAAGERVLPIDFDNDGDLDLVIADSGGPALLFRNDGGNRNYWLAIKARGRDSNRFGVGSKIRLTAGGVTQYREINPTGSYLSTSDMR
ncbi:MAG TPA: hypothetical protein VGQ32_07935, partial [Thermoanaerobaculia bacterium]|nr:hypothetical protein [Thermoanaerobaculia bacterium]